MKSFIAIMISACLLCSCGESGKKETLSLLREWQGKELVFPARPTFTIQGNDTVDYPIRATRKILTYVDSTGCTSCKLRFSEWEELMAAVDSIEPHGVQFLFFLCPKSGTEIYQALRVERFSHPVCIDDQDSLNRLNRFPSDMAYQTFLLDKDNKVLAMGNPIHNPKVKKLYLKIIRGDTSGGAEAEKRVVTEVSPVRTSLDFGRFDRQEERKGTFTLKNTGRHPLVIEQVNTSCGCTTVEYPEAPVPPGGEIVLEVTYRAEQPGHFSKSVTVYCNAEGSPITLKISGEAK